MVSEDQILDQLKQINQRLSQKTVFHTALNNFTAGFFRSIGNLIGTIVLFFVIVYFAGRMNIADILSQSFEQFLSQINWEKVIPQPRIELPQNLFQ